MTRPERRGLHIALPDTPGYGVAAQVFNLAAPARPAAATIVRTVDQIRAALRYAEAEDLAVRVHTTGHAAGAVAPMEGTLLLRTAMDGKVEVDPERRVARLPAGTRWGEVVAAIGPHGLVAPHGSAGTVGVVGFLLRGGLSWYGRRLGLAANSVRAVELVTADGRLRRVDARTDPELFWALRGGGGGFGVVTAVEVALYPAAGVFTGNACWPATHAGALLRRWLRWARDAPPQVTSSVRVMNLPPSPGIPPVLTSGPLLCVDGAVLSADPSELAGARADADELLGPLRSIAEPLLDTWQAAAPSAVLDVHMDPTEPLAFTGDHLLLRELGDEGAEQFLRLTGPGSGSPLVIAGLRQLGGAYAVPDPDGGALNHLNASLSYAGSGAPVAGATMESIRARCALVRAGLAAWDTGYTVPSFVESYEQPQRHLPADQLQAVERLRARIDPAGRFRGDVAPVRAVDR